jgi:hypothetical protein
VLAVFLSTETARLVARAKYLREISQAHYDDILGFILDVVYIVILWTGPVDTEAGGHCAMLEKTVTVQAAVKEMRCQSAYISAFAVIYQEPQ